MSALPASASDPALGDYRLLALGDEAEFLVERLTERGWQPQAEIWADGDGFVVAHSVMPPDARSMERFGRFPTPELAMQRFAHWARTGE
ncbi:hypothetical protein [Herbiconiux ginsengi]|uniref:Uncharacterized protein n=1 Tax=Herbiconiux ginsengi TaxID=381665 RepID=A0A1H3N1V8_9MICO|nr:hypothetical protein [Herbiconiux ginsengi]SDY82788.1 hypothetical protein SAMN05216554_1654 [Herbiconiux ginsengi]